MNLSILIPSYNSSPFISGTVARLTKILKTTELKYEILFWDDGSTDDSVLVLERLVQQFSMVKLFANKRNEGLGFTLRKLFECAQGEQVIYLDCDLPFGEEALLIVLRELMEYDVVVVSRYLRNSNKVPWLRRLTSRLYYQLCRVLFRIPVLDIGSGTVGMRRSAIRLLPLTTNGFEFHAEFYVQAMRHGLSIKEIPGEFQYSGQGSFRIAKHGPGIVWGTLKLWFKIRNQLISLKNK